MQPNAKGYPKSQKEINQADNTACNRKAPIPCRDEAADRERGVQGDYLGGDVSGDSTGAGINAAYQSHDRGTRLAELFHSTYKQKLATSTVEQTGKQPWAVQ